MKAPYQSYVTGPVFVTVVILSLLSSSMWAATATTSTRHYVGTAERGDTSPVKSLPHVAARMNKGSKEK